MYSDLQGIRIYTCKSRYYFEFKNVYKWNSLGRGCRIESWLSEPWYVKSNFDYNVVVGQMQTVGHQFYLLIKQISFLFIKKATRFGNKCRQKTIPYKNINRGTYSTLNLWISVKISRFCTPRNFSNHSINSHYIFQKIHLN